mmetsp:Transcript_7540/g.14814  ORF Transcript_7540/g.14814 Transcript_7540/m.14814 type:complete len:277 (-) Transcript_7540:75-905(-)|eukprot:CAMPEP_0175040844 /NCGR_PEP_ID=MMETSP0052_2-20121109/1524_1 /TAXON_ID=51329 ORGANISM="Polytomella parva, Strain SAG 63-3" /NCGR_SAMPLE_ID=MMETSP0052_2 /ASSEMBLY_ACC=CAM_ASM_000194 /LENGTH=276 /DNA_ID=CAMNT_0016303171 /DNA_START=32 /DNA_END=862 /DNA_ORIENTATION=+
MSDSKIDSGPSNTSLLSNEEPKKSLPPALLARLKARGVVQDVQPTAPPPTVEDSASTSGSSNKVASLPPLPPPPAFPAPPADPLPDGWFESFCEKHQRTYYYHPITRERTWLRPATNLLPGWGRSFDPRSGREYFYHPASGLRQWHRADAPDFIESETFQGRHERYVFCKGPRGIGYYLDDPAAEFRSSFLSTRAQPTVRSDAELLAETAAEARNRQQRIAEMQAKRNEGRQIRGKVVGRGRGEDELDPMDPSAYSDAPKGGWSVGLEGVGSDIAG